MAFSYVHEEELHDGDHRNRTNTALPFHKAEAMGSILVAHLEVKPVGARRYRARMRTGPRHGPFGSKISPRCVTSTSPSRPSARTSSRTGSSNARHSVPPTARAASDGQIVRGARWPASASTTARSRAERPSGVGAFHHGSPRSPNATLACRTRRRASRSASGSPPLRARATSRLAAMSSSTSSRRNGSGIDGSLARHRRPSTTIQCDSSPHAALERVAISHPYPIGTASIQLGRAAPAEPTAGRHATSLAQPSQRCRARGGGDDRRSFTIQPVSAQASRATPLAVTRSRSRRRLQETQTRVSAIAVRQADRGALA